MISGLQRLNREAAKQKLYRRFFVSYFSDLRLSYFSCFNASGNLLYTQDVKPAPSVDSAFDLRYQTSTGNTLIQEPALASVRCNW